MKHLKDNGFTLIEIIAVIVIMGILLMVVFPATTRIMKSNDEKKYDTYYDIVQAGLEKEARTRRNEVGGTVSSGCIDDKTLTDLINEGYVKEYDLDDDILCETVSYFSTAQLSSWGIDTSKDYASMMVIGDYGNISTRLSLICVKKYENGTFASEPEYVKLIEKGECSATVAPPSPPTPDTPVTPTTYTITYDANGGSSCTKTQDTLTSGAEVDLTPTCSRSNYTFKGWSTTKTGGKITYLTVGESNITLYALWTSNTPTDSCGTSIMYSDNYPDPNTNRVNLTKNGSYAYSTPVNWTNQPITYRAKQSAVGLDYSWSYNQSGVEIKSESKKINFGSYYINVYACVRYDTKPPQVDAYDLCTSFTNYEGNTNISLNFYLNVSDQGVGVKSVKVNNSYLVNVDWNGDNTLAGTYRNLNYQKTIRWNDAYNPNMSVINIEVCDFLNNCNTTTYQSAKIAADGHHCN